MDKTTIGLVVGGVVLLGGVRYVYRSYNWLVKLQIDVERQASHVQAHLKKKFDLIPALVEVVKGYAKHEKGTFEEVTKLRSQWAKSKDPSEKLKKASQLDSALSKLLFIQERYPSLKADKRFESMQKSIRIVERELLHERKVYNKRVSRYNMTIQMFPRNLIAKIFRFQEKSFFQFAEEEAQ